MEAAGGCVEDVADAVEVVLVVDGQVGSFTEPESELPVLVLCGGSLPWRFRVAEVDVDSVAFDEVCPLSEFGASVPGQRHDRPLVGLEPFREGRDDSCSAMTVGKLESAFIS